MKKLLVLIGPPGSGKSTMAKLLNVTEGYRYISQDEQGKAHLDYFDMAILAGENVVVDRMNFNKLQRSRYLEIAKQHGYETTITVIHQPRKVCYERMLKRENHPTIKDSIGANSALNVFFSKYEKPSQDEADIVNFLYPEGVKDQAIVCDLDGTLCNVDHRLHHVRKEGKKDWKAFFEGLDSDTPNQWCADLVDSSNKIVVFASGRPDDYKQRTRAWLEKWGFPTNHLYMRCRGDHRQDYVAKEIILDFEILTRFRPFFFIDDRKQIVDLWRSRGYVCLACANGDF